MSNQKKKGFVAEFQAFLMRGNVIDMAVGVIIGGAFQKIVSSLVDDIIMPLISKITGGIDFSNWFFTAVINFIIMAFVIFLFVKGMNALHEKFAKQEEAPVKNTKSCPYCRTEIDKDATRCPHCTSELS